MRRALIAGFFLFVVLVSACVSRETARVNQPISENLAAYWTCAVYFSTDGRGTNANEGFELVPWLEARIHERGIFEPLQKEEQIESEVIFRVQARTGNGRITMRVQLFDRRTNDLLGDLEALSSIEETPANQQEFEESRRTMALHRAAEEILRTLALARKESMAKPHAKPAPPPPPEPEGVGPGMVCSTQCQPTAASASTFDEQHRVADALNGTMKSLRRCLDRVGAQLVEPAVILRFSPDGQLHHMRVDVGGYEQNDCVRNVRTQMNGTVWATRASVLRCEYHCTTS